MNIYRNRKDNKLYLLYKVTPRGYTGGWNEAVPYMWTGKTLKNIKMDDFTVVASR